jgi:protein-disulfide isomerase
MPKHTSKKRKQSQGLWWVIGIAAVAAVGLIAVAWNSAGEKVEPMTPIAGVKSDADLKATRSTLGSPTAKVEVVEFGDFL